MVVCAGAAVNAAVFESSHSTPEVACRQVRLFRIQASISNPIECDSNDHGNLVESEFQPDRKSAVRRARRWLRCGYWVEVFDNDSYELVAGPFDPDQPMPTYIV